MGLSRLPFLGQRRAKAAVGRLPLRRDPLSLFEEGGRGQTGRPPTPSFLPSVPLAASLGGSRVALSITAAQKPQGCPALPQTPIRLESHYLLTRPCRFGFRQLLLLPPGLRCRLLAAHGALASTMAAPPAFSARRLPILQSIFLLFACALRAKVRGQRRRIWGKPWRWPTFSRRCILGGFCAPFPKDS